MKELQDHDYKKLWEDMKGVLMAMEWQNKMMGGKPIESSFSTLMENMEKDQLKKSKKEVVQ